ncbi:Vacuolar iron transporter -like protein 3 [Capsicum baccatum]|uniref:Vacuolar iron transporter n=1 Tax=Capsicum baccatum TaxID=33114 RepID=A0A2G2XCP4_CAPBA|nr:Vacuolar iron transporter -like protein 3 [Capsicum baccatum]
MDSPQSIEACAKKEPHTTAQEERTLKKLARAQWLRAAILGANDGLLSTMTLMLGVGAAKDQDQRSMVLSGVAGALAGACSMAVGEFVSVSTQLDIAKTMMGKSTEGDDRKLEPLPSPLKAAAASSLAFLCGAFVPLVPALLVSENRIRIGVMVIVASFALCLLGGIGAYLGDSSVKISAMRVLLGWWISMAITYGLLKPFDNDSKRD